MQRFDGSIAGFGTESGTRIVLGLWVSTPFGPIVDAMIERSDGHRILVAPSAEAATYIAETYGFDEVRVEPTTTTARASAVTVEGASLSVTIEAGRRTAIGWMLRGIPRPLARARWWCRAIDPIARVARPGVRTYGSAGAGRREYYCALDEHALLAARARLDGVALGPLGPVQPPVQFGFASAPSRPSIVRVTTLITERHGRDQF